MDITNTPKYYTLSEIAPHNQKGDCWIIIKNRVYDITTYLSQHPGGKASILRYAGKDATEMFFKLDHSLVAQDILATFEIGLVFE